MDNIETFRGFVDTITKLTQLACGYECENCHMDGKWDLIVNLDISNPIPFGMRINMRCRHCNTVFRNPLQKFISLGEEKENVGNC